MSAPAMPLAASSIAAPDPASAVPILTVSACARAANSATSWRASRGCRPRVPSLRSAAGGAGIIRRFCRRWPFPAPVQEPRSGPCVRVLSGGGRVAGRSSSIPEAPSSVSTGHRARGGEEAVLSDRRQFTGTSPSHSCVAIDGIPCLRKYQTCVHDTRLTKSASNIVAATQQRAGYSHSIKNRLKADHYAPAIAPHPLHGAIRAQTFSRRAEVVFHLPRDPSPGGVSKLCWCADLRRAAA